MSSHAGTDAAGAVNHKTIEGGYTGLEKQVTEKYFRKPDNGIDTNASKNRKKTKKKGLPPGLAKKEKLPPGLSRQLERNGTLPPGLAKRILPDNLESELTDPAVDLERAIVEKSVVLIDKATGRIVDILKDVVSGSQHEQVRRKI